MPVGRVSDQSRYLGLVPRYSELLGRQLEVQRQIASGKRFERADQDPLAAGLAQRFEADDARLAQNSRNIDEANSFTRATENAVSGAIQIMQRAEELAVAANDASLNQAARVGLATEVDSLLQGMINLSSEAYRGRNMFSGTETLTPSFTAVLTAGVVTGVTYNGDAGTLSTETTPGTNTTYNLLGSTEAGGTFGVFRDAGAGVDLFATLINLRDNITANPAGLSTQIQQIIEGMAHLTTAAANLGGTQNQLSAASALHDDQRELLQASISKVSETDLASAISELTALQSAYQASLGVGARITQISLLDFLR